MFLYSVGTTDSIRTPQRIEKGHNILVISGFARDRQRTNFSPAPVVETFILTTPTTNNFHARQVLDEVCWFVTPSEYSWPSPHSYLSAYLSLYDRCGTAKPPVCCPHAVSDQINGVSPSVDIITTPLNPLADDVSVPREQDRHEDGR